MADLLSLQQVGTLLGISRQRVLQLVNEGRLRAFRIGRAYAVEASAIVAYLEGNQK